MKRSLALVSLAAAVALGALWFAARSDRARDDAALSAEPVEAIRPSEPRAGELPLAEVPSATELAHDGSRDPLDARSAALPPAETAILAVQVGALPSGERVRRARVRVAWLEPPDALPPSVASANGRDTPTDWRGVAEIAVPARLPLGVRVEGPTQAVWNPDLAYGSWSGEVEPLGRGERRELECGLPHGLDLLFWGRVVDEAGLAIAGARVADGSRDRIVETGGGGLFQLELHSWKRSALLVGADGFAPTSLLPAAGHASPTEAFTVVLQRNASLEVRLVLPDGVNGGLALVLSTTPLTRPELGRELERRLAQEVGRVRLQETRSGFGPPQYFRAELDPAGRAVIEGLAPRVRYFATLLRGDEQLWDHPDAIVLQPGERRAVEWRVAPGARLAGRVLDSGGAGLEVWLLRDDGDGPAEGLAYLDGVLEHRDRTQCDGEGRFAFEGVQPGRWLVAPAPSEWFRSDDPVARVGVRVEVGEAARELELSLPLFRAPGIHGRVQRPDGSPVAAALVVARSDALASLLSTQSGPGGRFDLGLVHPSRHALFAIMASDPSDPSAPEAVWAEPGEELELILEE